MKQTTMVHVRVDEQIKAAAAATLDSVGLTISDAVRMLLANVANKGSLPAELTMTKEAYDAWFISKVKEGLADERPEVEHEEVIKNARALVMGKINAKG